MDDHGLLPAGLGPDDPGALGMLHDAIADVVTTHPQFGNPTVERLVWSGKRFTYWPMPPDHPIWHGVVAKIGAVPEETWVHCEHLQSPASPPQLGDLRAEGRYVFAAAPHVRVCHFCWKDMVQRFKAITHPVRCDGCGTPAVPSLLASVCLVFLVVSVHLCASCKGKVGGQGD